MIPLTGGGGYMSTTNAVPFVRGNGQTTSGETTKAPERDADTLPADRESANGANEKVTE